MCVWCINCLCAIGFWNCSKSVIFFELSRQCDIFWTVPTVWYFLNCSDSVIFVALFRQCDICCLSFYPSPGTVHYCVLYSSSYLQIDLHQNVVIVNTNRNTKVFVFCLLFCRPFSSSCPFFHLVVVLSISLKEQFEDTKGVVKTRKWKNGHYNDKQWSRKHYTEN
jgi:hypothetical protein